MPSVASLDALEALLQILTARATADANANALRTVAANLMAGPPPTPWEEVFDRSLKPLLDALLFVIAGGEGACRYEANGIERCFVTTDAEWNMVPGKLTFTKGVDCSGKKL